MSPRRSARAVVTVLALIWSLGVVLAPPASARAASACVFAAHRGYTAGHTENSLRSFAAAIRQHADYLEMDVQVTKDGVFTLMHDQTVNRTSTGTGRVIDATWSQLRRSRLNDGQRLPTLGAVLDLAKPTSAKVMLELKWIPNSRLPRLKRVINDFGVDRVVVNSFSPYVVRHFHQLYPDVPVALDIDRAVSVRTAQAYGGVMPDHRHVSLAWLASMRRAGVATYLWTLDNPRDWQRYRGKVTLLLTNRAADYNAWRARNCS